MLVNLKYMDGNSVAKHLCSFQELLNEFSTMKLILNDKVQALLLLSSLPDNQETLVVSLSNSAPNGAITIDMVKDSMFKEDARRKEHGTFNSEALVIERRGRSQSRKTYGDDWRKIEVKKKHKMLSLQQARAS